MKRTESKAAILWQLFKATFLLSAFTFGGGFVIVSLMKKKFVEELGWLEEDEMLDITAIAQSSPGPIPINASVILGYRMCGLPGTLVAILGTALPPMIIISVISMFYVQFRSNPIIALALQVMRAGVAAVIFDVVINLAKNVIKTRRTMYIGLMIAAFVARHPGRGGHGAHPGVPGCGPGGCGRTDPKQESEHGGAGMSTLLQLFFSFIQVGMFSVGGGYAAIPLIQNQIVDVHGLMSLAEFTDLITIAEMTPGPISINSATFVGMRLAGIPGVLLCSLGCILPSFFICLALAHFYYKYRSFQGVQTVLSALRPAVVALIASAGLSILMLGLFPNGYSLGLEGLHVVEAVIFVGALFLLRRFKLSAIATIFGSGVVGTAAYLLLGAL